MTELDVLVLGGFVIGVLVGCLATLLVLWPRLALRQAARAAGARPPDHLHAWELRSTEQTNRRRREIYVCAACADREIREVGDS